MSLRVRQYRVSRALGRLITTTAAVLTLGRMPPFVSTSAVVLQDGTILTVFDPIRDEPVLPGGHARWRESPEAALVREVREETGYDIELASLVGVFSGEEWTGEPGIVRIVYHASITGGALRSSPEGEAVWLPRERLAGTRDDAIVDVALGATSAAR